MSARILGLLLWLASTAAHAALVLEVSADSKPIPGQVEKLKQDKPPQASSRTQRVRLDDESMVMEMNGQRVIVDFVRRRKYFVDLKAATYSEESLFADVGFRVAEIQNREMLTKIAQKTQLPTLSPYLALDENELGIAHPLRPGTVERSEDRQAIVFSVPGLQIFSISKQGKKLAAGDARNLVRYFRYFLGGHPTALKVLQERQSLPAEITLVGGPFHALRTTVRFKQLSVAEAPSASLAGLKHVVRAPLQGLPPDLAEAAFAIEQLQPADIERAGQEKRERAEKWLEQGEAVKGFLAGMEYVLQTGQGEELIPKYRSLYAGSAPFAAMAPYISNQKSAADAERAVAGLEAASPSAGEMAYVLKIFEANHLVAQRKPGDAVNAFAVALRSNPNIAAAWKDLGDVLYQQYAAPAAWLCWDTGRKLAPDLKNLAVINQAEQRLAHDFPDFF